MQIRFKKVWAKDLSPLLLAITVFFIATIIIFRPAFTENKDINQQDINQWQGASKELRDYRESSGEEGLWANAMFSGMPAYLVNTEWSDQIITFIKIAGSLFISHPYRNIFLAMLSFYIMLLVFRVNPFVAIPFSLAFGLSSYMIIGVIAGHNARIGAIAFIPLVFAGIHYCLTYRYKLGGLALSALAIALHLRENHLQITYYILLIGLIYVVFYGLKAYKSGELNNFLRGAGYLLIAGIIALGTFFGKFWSTYEYSKYSIRGKSELKANLNAASNADGLSKSYAFEYSNGILEPMTMFIPDFFGGSAGNYLVQDQNSETYKALSRSDNPEMAQQLTRYTSSYWGNQSYSAPYYIGAMVFFFAILGFFFAPKEFRGWLAITSLLGIMLSWGDSFQSFNYLMFDYFPGYNKFRSVTFAIILPIFSLPLLGAVGLSEFLKSENNKINQKKFMLASGIAGGFFLLVVLFAGIASFVKEGESQLPPWFLNALIDDRESLMRADALRSLLFVVIAFVIIFLQKKSILKPALACGGLIFVFFLDSYLVDKRYLKNEQFSRQRGESVVKTAADEKILQDNSDYRVYNIAGNALSEGRTSYYHQSLGGYHGAKIRRYQELFEHCIQPQTEQLYSKFGGGDFDISSLGAINMLNTGYFVYGQTENEVIPNTYKYGSAWLASSVTQVRSADEELEATCSLNSKSTAIVNVNQSQLSGQSFDASGSVSLTEKVPGKLSYQADLKGNSLIVFSEIYYPEGWVATIDGQEADILRANYVLRALEVPTGVHQINFEFKPTSYTLGNKIIMVSNILLLVVIIFSLIFYFKKQNAKA